MNKVIYASDLDNTLIFSDKFVNEHKTNKETVVVEEYSTGHSVMDADVLKKLKDISTNANVWFVPVTTRDVMRYNRIKLGIKPEYAIVSNGGTILHNGEPMQEWIDYVKSKFNYTEAMLIITELETEMESVDEGVKVVDGCYIMFKTQQTKLYDQEILYFMAKYTNWDFVRQGRKCYVIPKHFSKQIALRWLWHKLNKPLIVASGDGELDIPMLSIANKAIIPEHSSLFKDGYVEQCTKSPSGISNALFTMKVVEDTVMSN